MNIKLKKPTQTEISDLFGIILNKNPDLYSFILHHTYASNSGLLYFFSPQHKTLYTCHLIITDIIYQKITSLYSLLQLKEQLESSSELESRISKVENTLIEQIEELVQGIQSNQIKILDLPPQKIPCFLNYLKNIKGNTKNPKLLKENSDNLKRFSSLEDLL